MNIRVTRMSAKKWPEPWCDYNYKGMRKIWWKWWQTFRNNCEGNQIWRTDCDWNNGGQCVPHYMCDKHTLQIFLHHEKGMK